MTKSKKSLNVLIIILAIIIIGAGLFGGAQFENKRKHQKFLYTINSLNGGRLEEASIDIETLQKYKTYIPISKEFKKYVNVADPSQKIYNAKEKITVY